MSPPRLVVGLTGGIGSGKSAAADRFAELGAAVIDTDVISRELTAAGGAAMPQIRAAFGDTVIAADGALDRDAMRARVFADPAQRTRLEAILHPMIRAEARRRLGQVSAPYVVLVVPLLVETGAYRDTVTRIVVVDCDEATQIARVKARSGLSEAQIVAVIRAQATREKRLALADDVIANDGELAHMHQIVDRLHQNYLAQVQGA